MSEFLEFQFEKTSLILIDEIETSLHPRVQRRMIRDLDAVMGSAQSE
jgi:predicted ATPase